MIVHNRRKRDGLLRRLTRLVSRITPPAGHKSVASPDRFQAEIDKEIHRANRREKNPEFAIVSLDFSDHKVSDLLLDNLIDAIHDRIRVSDLVGWHRMKLAVLLPETDLEGAKLVSESITGISESKGVEIQASISVYPWDDSLIGVFDQAFNPISEIMSRGDLQIKSDDEPFGGNDIYFDSPDDAREFGGNAVATMALPKAAKVTRLKIQHGTGQKILFARSEKTPVWKRCIDFTGASVGLILLSPVLMIAAASIKLTSKGPVMFRQQREGKDGEVFEILKFRTMHKDADAQKDELRKLSEQDGPAFKIKNDPRITLVGKYLRKSCIDELPQLFNVLTGKMSLVGPRPLPVNESQQCLPWQRQRLTVLPGLTCIWQARGSRNTKFAEWMRMDLEYIRERGFWYDIRLLGETAVVVVMHKGSV